MFSKIRDSLNQQIRDVRKDNLEPFLTSKNARMRQVTRESLDNPDLGDKFRAVIRLILRPIRRGLLLLISPINEAEKEKHYQSLLNSLSSGDTIEKETAIQELAEFPDKETNKIIADQLSDESRGIRLASVEALRKMRIKDAVEPLKETLLQETDCFTRIMISLCLTSLGDTSPFDNLFDDIAENSIQNDHWDMTDLVYSGLITELGEEAIPFLENGLRHSDWHIRWISLRVIYDLAEPKKGFGKYSFLKEDPVAEVQEIYDELLY